LHGEVYKVSGGGTTGEKTMRNITQPEKELFGGWYKVFCPGVMKGWKNTMANRNGRTTIGGGGPKNLTMTKGGGVCAESGRKHQI